MPGFDSFFFNDETKALASFMTSVFFLFPWIQREMEIFILLSTLLLLSRPSLADTNEILGLQCSGSDNATLENQYQINLNNLQDSLAANGPVHNGFYTATAGKDAYMIFGLTQCRGDISPTDCATCIRNSTMVRGCSTRLNFMNELAATAPEPPLMFQTAVLDVGPSGKRYGMAQCSRDISRSDCGKCFSYLLVTFRTTIGNKRGWEIYGASCSMWYHDYQFYFNFSIPVNEGAVQISNERVAIGLMIPVLVFLLSSL
ncbi:cysteine-rich repeat secretory protein 38 isoform X2 [Hevea brasiliensis]|uniref:cysteine-rich repeat secretory protein 38 isoform X2 n=1 Tax=Hevea brasiliensis TaxID=3981 RepID=UPI0025D84EAF|nr:cysteine-rich repeat secretory protein 38 isoform X2 [Hevea brasiliensis]